MIFSRDEEKNLSLKLVRGTITEDFSYVNMIKELIDGKSFEDPVYPDNITEEEKARISIMLDKINDAVSKGQSTAKNE